MTEIDITLIKFNWRADLDTVKALSKNKSKKEINMICIMLQNFKKMRYRHLEVKSRALSATNLGGSPEETFVCSCFYL